MTKKSLALAFTKSLPNLMGLAEVKWPLPAKREPSFFEPPVEKKKPLPTEKEFCGYKNEEMEKKRVDALRVLGRNWKAHPKSTFVNRGEHYLTIYFRETIKKRPAISLLTGSMILGIELKALVARIDDKERVYIGDLKLMRDQDA